MQPISETIRQFQTAMLDSELPICPVCGEPTKQIISAEAARIFSELTAGETRDRECRCKREEREANRQRAERDAFIKRRIQALRDRGIADALTAGMTFDTDRGYNPSVCATCKEYVAQWSRMEVENVGLMFTGGVGTGKTFYAACIANALIDRGVFALMTSLRNIIRTPFEQYESVLRSVEDAGLVVFDDLGAERDTSFAWERAFDAVDIRIRTRKPIIVTTNLSPEELNSAKDLREQRIYDRILGACSFVPVVGESIRKREQRQRAEILTNIVKKH